MKSHQKKQRVKSDPAPVHSIDAVRGAANAYIVTHYPFGCLGGTPRRLVLKDLHLWIIPLFLTSPGIGPVGEVGVVAVDERAQVIGGTERQDVAAAIRRLKESKRDGLEAAFLRARTA